MSTRELILDPCYNCPYIFRDCPEIGRCERQMPMKIEAYAWDEDDRSKNIKIEDFSNMEDARKWLSAQNTVNKVIAVSGQIHQMHNYLWTETKS